jgi:PAS domain S-box-containing protein
MYHQRIVAPHPRELSVVEAGAHLAGNVIERLTAERRLVESVERLQQAEEVAAFGIWERNLVDQSMTLSPGAAAVSGLERKAIRMTRSDLNELIHREDPPQAVEAASRAIEEHDSYRVEFRVQLPNGSFRWCRREGKVEYQGEQPVRMTGAIMDITKEKSMLEQLRQSAERMRRASGSGKSIWNPGQ